MLRVWGRNSSINVQKVLWCLAELGLKAGKIFSGSTLASTLASITRLSF